MAVDLETNPKKGRTRSPAYPYLDLRSALEKAAALWKAEGRHAAVINVVMHHWGYKEDSSTGYSSLAALKKFGLIDHDGIGENKQIRLSELALAILLDENPDSAERAEALRTAALSPRIHAELWERYGFELPSDQSLKRYLVLERNFNEAVVDELLEEYKLTISFAGLNRVPTPPAQLSTAAARPLRSPAPAITAVAEELPYDWRQEAAPAPLQPPLRAGGPASNGIVRREPETGAGRREAAGYVQNGREPMRYDQDFFGYDEAGYPLTQRPNGSAPSNGAAGVSMPPQPGLAPVSAPVTLELDSANGLARKQLPVPLDGDRIALVPYPMTEEDFSLLIATLQLWKKRLVRAGV